MPDIAVDHSVVSRRRPETVDEAAHISDEAYRAFMAMARVQPRIKMLSTISSTPHWIRKLWYNKPCS